MENNDGLVNFSILQDIGKKLEMNAEERAEIHQRISANKTSSDQKDANIESEIAEVRKAQEDLRKIQESFSLQVFQIWYLWHFPDDRKMIKTRSTQDTRTERRMQYTR